MRNLYQEFLIFFTIFFVLIFVQITCPDVNGGEGQWNINLVQIGIEGYYKNGLWTQANIHFALPENIKQADQKFIAISINTIDSDGTPVTYRRNFTDAKISNLTKNSNSSLSNLTNTNAANAGVDAGATLYFKPGRHNAKITVNIEFDGKIMAAKTLAPENKPQQLSQNIRQENTRQFSYNNSNENFILRQPVPNERQIILIIGNEDIGLQAAIAELALREERRPLIVKINSIASLPDRWFGYEAVDLIALTTTEPEIFNNLYATSPHITAIDKWIKLGGRILFCAGRNAEPLIKNINNPNSPNNNHEAPLTPFLPGKFEKMTDIRKGDLLETFVLSKRKIQIESINDYLIMPLLTGAKGVVRLSDGEMPVISQHLHGFGTITYFGGDLSGKPLASWRDRTALVKKILQWNSNKQNIPQQDMSLIRPAYNDISGQIRSAADRFDEIKIMPFSLILIILVAYWLIIGLGDWFIVRKLLKRPILTWLTFPLWILIFCIASYLLVLNGHSNRAILREIVVVDLNPEQNMLRYSVWGNLYSPLDTHYTLNLTDNLTENLTKNLTGNLTGNNNNLSNNNATKNISVTKNINDNNSNSANLNNATDDDTEFFSWLGLPGDGLGGMNPKTFNPTVWQTGSIHEQPEKIQNVPVQIRSTKSFYGEKFSANKNLTIIKSELFADEGLPVGELIFDGAPLLNDVVLVYGRWLMPVGSTPNNGKITIDKKSQRRDIGDILLSKIAMDNEALRFIATYNTQSTDVSYIVKVLSVHEQLGGYETIGLFNTFQRSLDMSNILTTNHAVLIGEVDPQQIAKNNAAIKISSPVDRRTKIILRQVLPITPLKSRTILTPDALEQIEQTIKSPIEEPERKR
ncbi:MAG: hypothetical protein LBP59_17075 [Planctomycetaceae bacterium]|jgi:hypothetical protein|nr:hypothetical protein [Planctomycetaceae bacterium]